MSIKLLVVDDAVVARKMIKRHLVGSHYDGATLVEASSAEKGLELFDDSVNVVLSDWNMPGLTGIEFVREIRKKNATVPIIMITTEGTLQKLNLAKDAGVDEYIIKPFSAEKLIEALDKVL